MAGHGRAPWKEIEQGWIILKFCFFKSFPEQAPEQRVMENYGTEEEEETLETVLGL